MPESASDSNNSPPKKSKSKAVKIAGALSTVLWVIGFILPFVFKPESPYVWVSDTLLLCGFWPLLFVYRAGWTWVIFGVLNVLIGFGLELVTHLMPAIPDSFWTPDKIAMKPAFEQMSKHIAEMHPCLPWILIGAISTIYGIIRIIKTIIKWIIKKSKKNA